MPDAAVPFASLPRAGVPPAEVVYTLTRDDLAAYAWYVCRNAPRQLPLGLRTILWIFTYEFFVGLPLLIVAAAGGIAVGVYFIARAACSPEGQAAGIPGNILWVYIVVVGLTLLVGFRPGGWLWRLLGRGYRHFVGELTVKHARRAAGLETLDPAWTYRLALNVSGFTRVIDQHENRGGTESYLRRTESAPWSVVSEVAASDEHLFLIVGGQLTFIVPARAFVNAPAFAAFVAEARRLHREAAMAQGSPVEGIDGRQEAATGGATAASRSTGIMVFVESVGERGRVAAGRRETAR